MKTINLNRVVLFIILLGGMITSMSAASPAATVAAGVSHSLFVKNDGTLWAMGDNSSGQLGDGTTTNRTKPVQIATGVTAIAAGLAHSLFVKNDGTLWAMGNNYYGQLGDGTTLGDGNTLNRTKPVQVAAGVTAVAAGYNHSLFVKNDGTLWGMGDAQSGALGVPAYIGPDGNFMTRPTPVQIDTGVIAIAAGNNFSMYLKNDGTVWLTGAHYYPPNGNPGTKSTPVQVATGITLIAAGGNHSLFVKNDGTLWAMGTNGAGQLGDGTTTQRNAPAQTAFASNVTAVAACNAHSLFVTNNNMFWGMGYNNSSQLGVGDTVNRITPVIVSGNAVSNVPSITTQPVNQSVAPGQPATFSVVAKDGWAYQWQYYTGFSWENLSGTTPYSGVTTATLAITAAPITLNGSQYRCIVMNSLGNTQSNFASLTVTTANIAPAFATQPAGQSVTAGQNATFTAAASGNPAPTYQWQSSTNGTTWTNITGATNATLTLTAVTTAINGNQYRCVATNSGGNATSNAAPLTVTTASDPATEAAQQLKNQLETPGSATIPVSGTINLSLVSGGATITSGKTIVGADANAAIIGGFFDFETGANDTVVSGITFIGGYLSIQDVRNLNISHCTFIDMPVTIQGSADNVTFSWNVFTATPSRNISAMWIGNSGINTGIILHHNLWGDGLKYGMPCVNHASVVMYNNYFTATGNTTATVSENDAQILSQNNIYQGVNNPLMQQDGGLIHAIDNFMIATTGTTVPGTDTVFVPSFSYVMQPAGIGTPLNANTLAMNITSYTGNTAGQNSFTPAQTSGTASITATVTGVGSSANATSVTVPDGNSFTLTAKATGFTSNPSSWQWYLDNIVLTNKTASTYNVPAASNADAGNYAVAITTNAGDIVTAGAFKVTITASTGTNNNGGNGGNTGGNNNNGGSGSSGGGGAAAERQAFSGSVPSSRCW